MKFICAGLKLHAQFSMYRLNFTCIVEVSKKSCLTNVGTWLVCSKNYAMAKEAVPSATSIIQIYHPHEGHATYESR
jgi:hypothetical protein